MDESLSLLALMLLFHPNVATIDSASFGHTEYPCRVFREKGATSDATFF